jgi:hypothetical protein
VDGVQWLDLDSAQVLRFLAAHVRGLPVLVQVAAVEQRRSSAPPDGVQMCPPPLLMIRLGRPANRRARRVRPGAACRRPPSPPIGLPAVA